MRSLPPLFLLSAAAPCLAANDTPSLWGWASLADRQRRQSLDHQNGTERGWQLEQSNLMLVISQPPVGHWTLDAGIGVHWQADQGSHHTAGWQTLVGVTWNSDK